MLRSMSTSNVDPINVSASTIFEEIWNDELEKNKGEPVLPKEIMWLGGAPGSGKGTNTKFIMKQRGLTAPPIVISDLLKTPEMESIKAQGGMVGDLEVTQLLVKELQNEKYRTGVVVDGFPRTGVQAEITRQLYDRMMKNYNVFKNDSDLYKRPIFRICVLYVDMMESMNRQLARGQKALAHNKKVRETGEGEMKPERVTDFDPELAKKRYVTFRESTFNALEELGERFIYNMVQAMGTIPQVQENIKTEMDYQSGLELNPETHEKLHHLDRASEVTTHARQELVRKLDTYASSQPGDFEDAVSAIEKHIYPTIRRHSLTGKCEIPLKNTPLTHSDVLTDIMLCVLTDRGFRPMVRTRASHSESLYLEWDVPKLRMK